MDNPGHSLFSGGSLLDGLQVVKSDDDDARLREEEEEGRRREEEIENLVANEFNDSDDEEYSDDDDSFRSGIHQPSGEGGDRRGDGEYVPPGHQDHRGRYHNNRTGIHDQKFDYQNKRVGFHDQRGDYNLGPGDGDVRIVEGDFRGVEGAVGGVDLRRTVDDVRVDGGVLRGVEGDLGRAEGNARGVDGEIRGIEGDLRRGGRNHYDNLLSGGSLLLEGFQAVKTDDDEARLREEEEEGRRREEEIKNLVANEFNDSDDEEYSDTDNSLRSRIHQPSGKGGDRRGDGEYVPPEYKDHRGGYHNNRAGIHDQRDGYNDQMAGSRDQRVDYQNKRVGFHDQRGEYILGPGDGDVRIVEGDFRGVEGAVGGVDLRRTVDDVRVDGGVLRGVEGDFGRAEGNTRGIDGEFRGIESDLRRVGGDLTVPEGRREHYDNTLSNDSTDTTPWSDDSRHTRPDSPLSATNMDYINLPGHTVHANIVDSPQPARQWIYNAEESSYIRSDIYQAENYQTQARRGEDGDILEDQYQDDDTQLRLLYDARGRQLDQLSEELQNLRVESGRDVRMLHHQINLLKSDTESKTTNLKQLNVLLMKKDENLNVMKSDLQDLTGKLTTTQEENKNLNFALQTAQSTISSLDCEIRELKAADILSRNQKLQEDFVRKLQNDNQEEKDILKSKLQTLNKENGALQCEIKQLRGEIKNLRTSHDEALTQKSETVVKLNVIIETLRKQYEELLRTHDSQRTLELELNVNKLEAENQSLEVQVQTLDNELTKAKNDLDGYDRALKLGLMSDVIPNEDSMIQLGIRKTLKYDEPEKATDSGKKASLGKQLSDNERVDLKEELRKSLMINTAKRNEISQLMEANHEIQGKLRKANSEVKDAHVKITELHGELLKLQTVAAEQEKREKTDSGVTVMRAENSALRKELAQLLDFIRDKKILYENVGALIENLKSYLSKENSGENITELNTKLDMLLQNTNTHCKLASESEQAHNAISQLREENSKLHEDKATWERRLWNIEIQLKVSEKIVVTATTGRGKSGELGHASSTLQKLLDDITRMMETIKKEFGGTNIIIQKMKDDLTAHELELERKKDEILHLQEEINTLAKNKDEERESALQDYRTKFLKFHDDAMQELRETSKAEYDKISDNLKQQVTKLADELSNVKEIYVQVSREKNKIEDQLDRMTKEADSSRRSQGRVDGAYVATPDSGIVSPTHESQQQVLLYRKRIKDLEGEVAASKEILKKDMRKLVLEKEEQQIHYTQQLEEKTKTIQDVNQKLEKLEKQCKTLEEINDSLRSKCTSLEEILKQDKTEKEKDGFQVILERQERRWNQEREEMQVQFKHHIQELETRYNQAESSKLLEDVVREKEEKLRKLETRIREQEGTIRTVTSQLERAAERAKTLQNDHEEEVRKLTDMVQGLEGDLLEKKEENKSANVALQKFFEEHDKNRQQNEEKLRSAKAEIARLKEIQEKYVVMKRKFIRFQDQARNCKVYYESEFDRIIQDARKSKSTVIESVRVYVEEVQGQMLKCVENIQTMVRDLDSGRSSVDLMLAELVDVTVSLKNFKLEFAR